MAGQGGGADTSRVGRAAGWGHWLGYALLLHAAGLLVICVSDVGSAPRSSRIAPPVGDAEVSLSFELAQDAPPARASPPEAEFAVPVAGIGRRAAALHAVAKPGAADAAMGVGPAPPVGDGALPPATDPAPRRLSLEQLGVGVDGRGALLAPAAPLSPAASAERRLEDSMLTGLAMGDSAKGIGIEGPAVRAVTGLVLDSDLPLATTARLLVVADSGGLTRSVAVLESGADAAQWRHIADALRRALALRKLRIPAGSDGVSFQLVVTSRALLASGAQATLETEVFGKSKRESGTPPAGRVSLLPREPELARALFPQLEGSHPQPWGNFTTNIGSGSADLSDLNSGSRRIVTARLAHLDVRLPSAGCSGGAGSGHAATAGCRSTTR